MARIPQSRLDQVLARFDEVEARMGAVTDGAEIVALAKEHAALAPVAEAMQKLAATHGEIADLEDMVADTGNDADMRAMAREELDTLKSALPEQEHALQLMLLPKDKDDSAPVMLEVRAGTGGDEAALFAGDLLRMYQRYAQLQGWKMDMVSSSEGEMGGYKEAIVSIRGENVFGRLKFESGVHRVQRVPETEAQGRIHTSAATVAVLPEPEDVDIKIDDKDLRIDVFRASGPGGQSVNTTDSAVRITHLPTGVTVSQQDEKSQHKNRAKAMQVLRARLYQRERERVDAKRAAERKGQVGSGDRSERIRTYNYPQGRVTDHRINLTLYKLDKIIAGEALGEIIDALVAEDQAARLSALEDEPVS